MSGFDRLAVMWTKLVGVTAVPVLVLGALFIPMPMNTRIRVDLPSAGQPSPETARAASQMADQVAGAASMIGMVIGGIVIAAIILVWGYLVRRIVLHHRRASPN